MSAIVYTIGHSTHPLGDFIRILRAYGIEEVVDVRTIPGSRHSPQFNEENLREELRRHQIGYVRMKGLGGLRRASKNSMNTAWKNASFRGYADYMQTPGFAAAIDRLAGLAKEKRVAIMCAEAVPWRCHRSLIGDALLAQNLDVEDILGERSSRPHRLTPWARVEGDRVTYPGPPDKA